MALTYPDRFTLTATKIPEGWGVSCLDGGATGKTLPEALRNCAEMLEVTEGMEGQRRLRDVPTAPAN